MKIAITDEYEAYKDVDYIRILENKDIDRRISIAISSIFIILMGQYFILINFNLIDSSKQSIVQLISKVLVAIVFAYALPPVLKRSKLKFIVIYFVSIFIILINILLFNENIMYIKELLFPIFFMSIPSFVYIMSINDIEVFQEYIYKASKIVFIMGMILSITVFTGKVSVGTYSMSLSYYMLFPAIMYLNNTIEKQRILDFICLIISLISIISLGSRGALLCMVFFLLLKIIKTRKRFNLKQITFFIIYILTSISFVVYFKNIIIFIRDVLYRFGIQSRTLELLLRDDIYMSGRDSIYNDLIIALYDNPIMGVGLGGDRKISGGYAHNIFIEILCNFGILLGLIIIISIIMLMLKSLIINSYNNYNIVIFWLSVGFIHLFVSSSYLTDIKFWVMLGIIVRQFNKKSVSVKLYY